MNLGEISKKLKQQRKFLKLTQDALSERSGISRPTISNIENNKLDNVSIRTLDRLLESLGLELSVTERSMMPNLEELLEKKKSGA